MTNYDFGVLQPAEFECLTRDLIQARESLFVESFTDGRDGGIDLRFAPAEGGTVIVQAKRYKDFSSLFNELKREVSKVTKLNPKRYIVATSVGLSPGNKTDIQNLFGASILATSDILGRTDLNALLRDYPEVEKSHYKLWLSSSAVLDRIINRRIMNWTDFERDLIYQDIHLYAMNPSFEDAMKILVENNYLIISGIPGIGKTTLARMLIYKMLAEGVDEFIKLNNLQDAAQMLQEGKTQVFFFDDFLGSTFLDPTDGKFDSLFVSLVEKFKRSKGKYLICTTREYILSEALTQYEKLSTTDINIVKCCLDLRYYDKKIKAEILYNHLADSNIPPEYVEVLLDNRSYNKIINHTNFNPRIIETFIREKVWRDVKPNEFMSTLLSFFDKPTSVWKFAFEKLDRDARHALLVRCTLPEYVSLGDWKEAFQKFCSGTRSQLGIYCDSQRWKEILKILSDCFVKVDYIRMSTGAHDHLVQFFNPSVRDFIVTYLADDLDTTKMLVENALFMDQLHTVFRDNKNPYYTGFSQYVILEEPYISKVIHRFEELRTCPKVCEIKRHFNSEPFEILYKKNEYSECWMLDMLRSSFRESFMHTSEYLQPYLSQEVLKDSSVELYKRLMLIDCVDWNKMDFKVTDLIADLQISAKDCDDIRRLTRVWEQYREDEEPMFDTLVDKEFITDLIRDEIGAADDYGSLEDIKRNIDQLSTYLPNLTYELSDDIEAQKTFISTMTDEADPDAYEGRNPFGRDDKDVAIDVAIHEMMTALRQ